MFGSKTAIGIDCSDDVWRLVALRLSGAHYTVLYAGSLTREEREAAGEQATALAAMLREAGGMHSRVAVSLPTFACTFKTANLPPGKAAEIEQVVRFEAENQFPLPLPELVWGYSVTPDPTGRRHAVIVGARRSLVEERLDLCRQAGEMPTQVLPSILASARTFERGNAMCAVVLVGAEWSDLCLYDGDRLLHCRSVAIGNPESNEWAENVARELRPWIVTYDGLPQILLLGVASENQARLLSEETAGIPVAIGHPWRDIMDPRKVLPSLEDPPAVFATAVGLAKSLLSDQHGINLLPNEFHVAAQQQRKLAWTLVGFVCALVLATLLAVHSSALLRARQQVVAQLTQQIATTKKSFVPEQSPAVNAAGDIMHSVQAVDGRPLDILSILSQQMPPGVTLTDFTYSREKAIILQGHAATNIQVVSAISSLDHTAMFDNVMLNYSNQTSATNKIEKTLQVKSATEQGYDFQITCNLPSGSDITLGTSKLAKKTAQNKGTVGQ